MILQIHFCFPGFRRGRADKRVAIEEAQFDFLGGDDPIKSGIRVSYGEGTNGGFKGLIQL